MTCCPVCDTAVSTLANVYAVQIETTITEHGTATAYFAWIVCDGCGKRLRCEVDQTRFYTAKALLRAKPAIRELRERAESERVNHECRQILAREGLA